jgi:arylformamidase
MEASDARASTGAIYRGMDRATLDAAYDNGAAVPDRDQWVSGWRQKSALMRAMPQARLDLPYGVRPRERIDYFPSGAAKAPLFVFIHGGYWQRNEKETFAFVAEGPRAHGIDVAVPGYTLAPDVHLADIVAEMRLALSYLSERAAELGFDRNRIFVGGWSAGGHLTAAVANHPAVRGGLPISGIFDLEPIALTNLNDKLALSADEIATLSPLRTLSDHSPPLRMVVGGAELPELKRQSETFTSAAQARGLPVELNVLAGHHHFSILDEIARPDGALTQELGKLIAAAR